MHLLRFEDRNSMYHSIESRVPFLNKELADFLISLPAEFIISDKGVTKFVFREAMRGIVPDSILQRNDKIGFATPQANWLRCASDWISDVLSLNVNHEEVDFQEIKEIVHRFQKGTNDVDQDVVWRNLHFLQFKHSVTGQCQVT